MISCLRLPGPISHTCIATRASSCGWNSATSVARLGASACNRTSRAWQTCPESVAEPCVKGASAAAAAAAAVQGRSMVAAAPVPKQRPQREDRTGGG
eukprot:scaffold70426_cov108-Phaeocystis_antarctica.AAC.2